MFLVTFVTKKYILALSESEGDHLKFSHDFTTFSGVIRLVEYLSGLTCFGKDEKAHIVVDAGTGTTAVGLALGAVCLGCVHYIYLYILAFNIHE
jgi:hypothetical protein